MFNLLKILKQPSLLDEVDRLNIMKKLCELSKDDDYFVNIDEYLTMAINDMISKKVKNFICKGNKAWTRKDSKVYNDIISFLKSKRKRRNDKVKIFKIDFKHEIKQSIQECNQILLKYYRF